MERQTGTVAFNKGVIAVANSTNGLIAALSSLSNDSDDKDLIATALLALDDRYDLSGKMGREPGLEEIIKQLAGRIYRAYSTFSTVKGKRILDIASGSNTSKALRMFM